jgi:hypothetical protein
MAIQFGIDNEDMWDRILSKISGDPVKVGKLMKYSDVYAHPERFIAALPDDSTLSNVSQDVQTMYTRIDSIRRLLDSAVDSVE